MLICAQLKVFGHRRIFRARGVNYEVDLAQVYSRRQGAEQRYRKGYEQFAEAWQERNY